MIKRRHFMLGSATGLIVASSAGYGRAAQSPTPRDVYFDPDNPVLGNPDGDVTIAEYFDFQCPYCKRDFPTVRETVEKDGKVRLVMKDWPIFGEASLYGSQLTLAAAKTGQYASALEALMATEGRLSRQEIDLTLTGAGLDVPSLRAAYKAHKAEIDALLLRNNAQAEAFAFPGTPAYLIGKTIYPGVIDEDALRAAIALARPRL